MLIPSKAINDMKLLSIRSSRTIGYVTGPIVNPRNLHIDGFYVQVSSKGQPKILLAQDIREIFIDGLIIDDHDLLADREDLVRLEETIKLKYTPEEKSLFAGKHKIGKIQSYAFDSESLFIIKLYAGVAIWKNINTPQRTIDRQQIIEITPKKIVIDEATIREKITNAVKKSDAYF